MTTIVRSGRGSSGPITSPVGVVQEGHVAHQRQVAVARPARQRRADRRRDGAVDAGQAAVGDHLVAAADVVGRGHQVEVADRVGGADDEVPAGRQRPAHRTGHVVRREPRRRRAARPAAATPRRRPPATRPARPGRRARRRPGRAPGSRRTAASRSGARRAPRRRARARSRCTGRDSVGWPKSTHPLDLLRQLGGQQQPVGPQRRAGARPARRLGQQRPAGLGGQRPGPRAGVVAGHHDGARSERRAGLPGFRDGRRAPSSATGGASGTQRSAGTSGSSSWTLRCTSPGPIDVIGASTSSVAHLRPEDADLVGGLVGVGAAQPGRPVRGDHDERHPRVVRLEHGRVQVRHRGPGGADDRGPRAALGQPEGQEAGGPLVDPRVQPEQPRLRGVVRRERRAARCATPARPRPRGPRPRPAC